MTKRVVVVGAGLAGLTAAYRILNDADDVDVTVIEANPHPGGRMLTTEFGGEAGGESIGFYYTDLHRMAEELGVEIGSAPITILNKSFNIAYYYSAREEWIQQADWSVWEHNPLPPEFRQLPPIMLLRTFVNRVEQPAWYEFWSNPTILKLTTQSLKDLLEEQGAPAAAKSFVESNFEVNDSLDRLSAISFALKTWLTNPMADSRFYFVKGGNQALPKALAKAIGRVVYDSPVARVESTAEGHVIETVGGERYEADQIVLAVPPKPLLGIEFNPPLPADQVDALEVVRHTPAVKCFFKVEGEFWEEDGLPITMWTDRPELNMVIPVYEPATREHPLAGPQLWGIYTVSNGMRARTLYAGAEDGTPVPDQLVQVLEEIRPSLKGKLNYVESADWGHDPFAGGAFHYFEPSPDIPKHMLAVGRASRRRYFACEHTEYKTKGFDAAMSSGLRAAREVCCDQVERSALILGCGSLGSELARTWYERFHHVSVTTTTPARYDRLSEIADEVHVLRLEDSDEAFDGLQRALVGVDVAVFLVGPRAGVALKPQEIDAHYEENLVIPARLVVRAINALPDGARPHLIAVSSLNVYGTGEDAAEDVLVESSTPSPTNASARRFLEAEEVLQNADTKVTVLRAGALYDLDGNSLAGQLELAHDRMGGKSPFDPDGRFLGLRVRDAARAIDFVSQGDGREGTFHVCDDAQPKIRDHFERVATLFDMPPVEHLGFVKAPRKAVSMESLRSLGFETSKPRVLFVGSGVLSLAAARRMLEAGWEVALTTTREEKVATLKETLGERVEVLRLEGSDSAGMEAALAGRDAVVVAVAPDKRKLGGLTFTPDFYSVVEDTYKGTAQTLVRAWLKSPHRPQIVHVSAHTVYPDQSEGVVDETTYALPRHRIAGILREAESTILDWASNATVLRLGALVGPQRSWASYLEKLGAREVPFPADGEGRANVVHIEDASRSLVHVIENGLSGIYNVCGDAHPSWGALLDGAAHRAGLSAPDWRPDLEDRWFEGDQVCSSAKLRDTDFIFEYPHETGLGFVGGKRRVLVVGAGYLGGQLLQALSGDAGIELGATTTTEARFGELTAAGATKVWGWEGSSTDDLLQALEWADQVVVAIKSPVHDNESILGALRNLAKGLSRRHHVVFVSSLQVYPSTLEEAYTDSELMDSVFTEFERAFDEHGQMCTLRIGQLFGSSTDHRGMARDMRGHLDKIFLRTEGKLPGDGNFPIHLTHVDDAVRVIRMALEGNVTGIMNVCRTHPGNRKELYEELCSALGHPPIEWVAATPRQVAHLKTPVSIDTERVEKLCPLLSERYELGALLEET